MDNSIAHNEDRIPVTNIQRFSLHDGPGIRTTVFVKGCSLRCPWCSNPENLYPEPQEYIKDGMTGVWGRYYSPEELLREVLKDKNYYDGDPSVSWDITEAAQIDSLPGGCTFSGGEALLRIKALLPVLRALKENGVHTAVETCLFVPPENVRLAAENIDFFYVDVKMLDKAAALETERGDLSIYLDNLRLLLSYGRPTVIRIPVIGGFTDDAANRQRVRELLESIKDRILKTELIKEHDLGVPKYRSLGMPLPACKGVSDELMEEYKRELSGLGIPVEICSI